MRHFTKNLTLLITLFVQFHLFAQNTNPFFEERTPLPEPVSNNAVCAAMANDTACVYSFMGIDTSKTWSGIHLKAWRMNTVSNQWQALPPVPDPAGGRIASAASTVKNRIYVIGGYHVAQNGAETSSNKVHRFDPQSNTWLPDGANIPKAIDDHVQAVWRDSLIFVITGWSNAGNVANVQIYNPATDVWVNGTSVPNNTDYKAFGASGIIHGDTIYYCGGARDGSNFPAVSVFRKGYIHPDDPTQISWFVEANPLAKGYRMAAANMAGGLVWLGGSDLTYNYNGIAYNGSGGVPALARARTYYDNEGLIEINAPGAFPNIMDLRGVGQIAPDYFITVGGMGPGQKVSDKVYGFSWAVTLNSGDAEVCPDIEVFPNPVKDHLWVKFPQFAHFQLFDANGKLVRQVFGTGLVQLETADLPVGTYFLMVWDMRHFWGVKSVIVLR